MTRKLHFLLLLSLAACTYLSACFREIKGYGGYTACVDAAPSSVLDVLSREIGLLGLESRPALSPREVELFSYSSKSGVKHWERVCSVASLEMKIELWARSDVDQCQSTIFVASQAPAPAVAAGELLYILLDSLEAEGMQVDRPEIADPLLVTPSSRDLEAKLLLEKRRNK